MESHFADLRRPVVSGTHLLLLFCLEKSLLLSQFRGGFMTTTRFFVYGSLCEGMVHFPKIQSLIDSASPATIQGTAYRLKVGFPILVNSGSDLISGQCFEIRTSDLWLNFLDEMNGCNSTQPDKSLQYREQISVTLPDGNSVLAWCYFCRPDKVPSGAQIIEGGDWRQSLEQTPALPHRLTDRQKAYIVKLGGTSGREIVPIDLQLYRELMNLELIVDKGRRLALSKLGHEVYRYL